MSTICDDLRAAILQAAMQGKLTKQLPEDGSAEDLLEEIKAEKEKLISEGKIKKQKPLAPITDNEIPFSIPENWKWVRMADLFTIVTGKKDANFGSNSGKYRFFTCARTPIYSSSYSFSGESILLAGNGDIGNISYYDGDFEAYQRTYVLQPFVKHTYAEFVLRHLMGNWVEYNKDKLFGTAIPYIRLSNVEEYLVAFPPLPEQKRIVEKVDELMARVADLEQSADAFASLKKAFPDDIKASLLQAAMQGKLTKQLPGDGDMNETFSSHSFDGISIKYGLKMDSMDFEIPNTWAMATMDELFNFVDYRGKTPHKIKDGKIFLITSSNIKNGFMDYTRKEYISEAEYVERQTRGITHRGDLLFTTEAPMGNAAICDLEVCSCGQRIITFQEKENNTVMPELFMYFILSPSFQKLLEDNCTGTTAKGIKGAKLKHFLIPVPPLAEQRRIVERLEHLIQNINVVRDLIASE